MRCEGCHRRCEGFAGSGCRYVPDRPHASATILMDDLQVTQLLVIPARELSWTAARAGGPGGQNVNKVASKVDLRFPIDASEALDAFTKSRLKRLARHRLDAAGTLRITSQKTRDQGRNLEDARLKLAELIRKALERPTPRKKTRPSRGAVERRLKEKRQNSERKGSRSAKWD